jgi:hypothetical protein
MLTIFQVVCGCHPTCACRKALTSSSVGKFAGILDDEFEAAVCAFAGLPGFPAAPVLGFCCAERVVDSISSNQDIHT